MRHLPVGRDGRGASQCRRCRLLTAGRRRRRNPPCRQENGGNPARGRNAPAGPATIIINGLLFSIFYILTALAAIVYYRRRIVGNAWDFVTAGLLPLGAAGFLGWIFVKSLGEAPWEQRWSLIGVVIAGLVLMVVARFVLRSGFFSLPREAEVRSGHRRSRLTAE